MIVKGAYIASLFKVLSKILPGYTAKPEDGIVFWRQKILFYLCFALVYFSIPVLIVSIIVSIKVHLYSVAIFNFLIYIIVFITVVSKKITNETKSLVISIIFYTIGVYILILVGPNGAGLVWLFSFPVFAGLLLGRKTAYLALTLNFITIVLFAVGLDYGFFKNYYFGFYDIAGWITVSINFIVINLAVTITVSILLEGLKNRMKKEVLLRENIQLAKERAEYSDKQKSTFLADMSHEIRSPMNAILGFSELLRSEDLPKDKQELYFNIINEKGKYLLQLINDIIDISRIESNQIKLEEEICDLREIMEELYSSFSGEVQSRKIENLTIKLDIEVVSDRSLIFLDPVRFKQVMINLLSNAIKFTKDGTIEFGFYRHNSDIITFFVKDTGIGMTAEAKEKIFERFEQVKGNHVKKFEGAGLGLYITKNLIDLMEGKIWVESNPNLGSCFYFQIPYHPATQN